MEWFRQFLFYVFAATSVAGALGVAITRNPIRGALWLVECLFSLAVLFVMLDAHLLAALEVLVYAGAVMVLFLFVIMLLNLREEELGPRRFTLLKLAGVLGCGYLLVLMNGIMRAGEKPFSPAAADFGTLKGVGTIMFTNYLLPFELTSVLLLAAVVGAVVLAKRKI